MLNFTYIPASGNSRYEFKNIFNQLGKDRYTYRKGTDAQSDYEESAEYYYQSRTTYNGQFTGKHTLVIPISWIGVLDILMPIGICRTAVDILPYSMRRPISWK